MVMALDDLWQVATIKEEIALIKEVKNKPAMIIYITGFYLTSFTSFFN